MTERWRPVPGFEGFYEVSDHGRVRSLDRTVLEKSGKEKRLRGRMMTASKRDIYGHLVVTLCRENCSGTRQVHHLVLLAFGVERRAGMECRHLDGNAANNRLENLAWGTSLENKRDLIRHGTHHYARRSHCNNGHEFTAENTLPRPDGGRRCKDCKNARERRYYLERQSA